MKKIENIQNKEILINIDDLDDLQKTNYLFLELLYNLSKYPHPKNAKNLIRQALFTFEMENIFKENKIKEN